MGAARAAALAAWILWATPAAEAEDQARISCKILENGKPASGTWVVRQGDREITSGNCGESVRVAPGSYIAVVRLDGSLDGPAQEHQVVAKPGQPSEVVADFPTGVLEVRIESQGRRTAGMAIIRREGRQIGTLGSGVAAHLSAGTYEVVARYRTSQQVFDSVRIEAGERRVLEASFD